MQHRRKNNDNKKSHRTIRCHIYIQCYNNTNYNSSNKKLDKFNNIFEKSIIRKSKNPAKPKQKVQNPTKIGRNHNSKRLSKYESRNIKRQKKSIGN